MKTIAKTALVICTVLFIGSCGSSYKATDFSRKDVNSTIAGWPSNIKEAANALMGKYGQPDEITGSMLIWRDRGVWKKTVLSRDEIPHNFPMPHTDFLQQTINYRVPPGKYDDLARFDGSVIVERTKGTLSARCDKEELNILALNLANDIVSGKRTVQEARDHFAKIATKFKQGGTDPYLQAIQFSVSSTEMGDRDSQARDR